MKNHDTIYPEIAYQNWVLTERSPPPPHDSILPQEIKGMLLVNQDFSLIKILTLEISISLYYITVKGCRLWAGR